jgi:type II secretory pathway component GspD/PulD (secretin)
MKIKLLMAGIALTGVLVALNHITFGQTEELPDVPVTGVVEEAATEDDAGEASVDTIDTGMRDDIPVDVVEGSDGEDLITISLDNAPLADVVRMFSRISGANIVAGTNLQGSVTVSMHDVPWQPALEAILDSVNLVLVEKQNSIYSIISKRDLAAEPVQMETIFLNYTSVSNVMPVVERMLVATNASVSAFPSANALVVQETASRLSAIRGTVKQIDKPRPQVYIEAKFIELNDTAIQNLGVNWQVLEGYTLGVTPTAAYTRDRVRDLNDSQVTDASVENRRVRTSTSTSGRNDVRFNSNGTIDSSEGSFDASLTGRNAIPTVTREEDEFGNVTIVTELQDVRPVLENVSSSDSESISTAIDSVSKTVSRIDSDVTSRLLSAVLSADELAVTLSALKEQDGVEVVSNPKVIVANGETASIHVGRNEPNVTAVPQGDTGDRFAYSLDPSQPYIEIGVKLDVTPTVNTEENITVKIIPELSRKLGDLEVGGAIGVSYPITSIRKITTEFQIESGKTVAIGGLTESNDVDSRNTIPVLGDIPVIGKYLFSHKSTQKVQDEVVIFVTVGMASPDSLVEISGIPSTANLIHRHLANEATDETGEYSE